MEVALEKVLSVIVLFTICLITLSACSTNSPQIPNPTPNIEATVQARVSEELASQPKKPRLDTPDIDAIVEAKIKTLLAVQPTYTPYPTHTPLPQPTYTPIPTFRIVDPIANTPEPSITVEVVDTVNNIVDLYTSNEVGAEVQYTNKWADITGQIYEIEAKNNQIEVNLEAVGELFNFTHVVCKMSESYTSEAAQLRQGQVVTVRGKILGVPGFSNIVVEPCALLR